jgi:hypothetical protein
MPASQHCNLRIPRIAAIAAVLSSGGCSNAPPPAQRAEAPQGPAVRIVQFYAANPRIAKGEATQLCYSVEGASKLRLEPPVEQVWPAYSRCFEVRPAATTTYTLTAADSSGHGVSGKATIEVGGARSAAPASSARMIQEVTVNKLQVAAGEPVVICYTANGAASVKVTPGETGSESTARGCVTDRPRATTTYRVVASSASGAMDSEQVVVKVR